MTTWARIDKTAQQQQRGRDKQEDELFEISLEVLKDIPSPKYYEHQHTTKQALFANCLLPAQYICAAKPIESSNNGVNFLKKAIHLHLPVIQ